MSETAPLDSGQVQSSAAPLLCCDPHQCAYFLDFDGTLVEIAEHPSGVDTDDNLLSLLAELHGATSGALAIISGRPIGDIDRLFQPLRLPVAGQHGAERRDAEGRLHRHPLDTGALNGLRAAAAEWQLRCPGLVIEDKGLSIAFHFRQQPALASPLAQLLAPHRDRLGAAFHVQTGKMVLEVKPSGMDKGYAIREFLRELPFRGRTPVFIGDDDTDEYGFAEVNTLGGASIKVGSGPSVAKRRLPDVMAVRLWLRGVLNCGQRK